MEHPFIPLFPRDQAFYTSIARQQIDRAVRAIDLLTTDLYREDRLASGQCRCCYYLKGDTVAGQAMTTWFCRLCGTRGLHANTNTPRLCEACSTTHELCRRCGADIDLRKHRTDWPTPVDSPIPPSPSE